MKVWETLKESISFVSIISVPESITFFGINLKIQNMAKQQQILSYEKYYNELLYFVHDLAWTWATYFLPCMAILKSFMPKYLIWLNFGRLFSWSYM